MRNEKGSFAPGTALDSGVQSVQSPVLPQTTAIRANGIEALRPFGRVEGNQRSDAAIRVLYLVDTLNIGGTETQMTQAALRLFGAGYEITVACLRAEGPLLRSLKGAGIPVVEFRKEKTLLSLSGIHQLLRLIMFLRVGKFHVMHAHDLWSNLLGVPAAWIARTPVVVSSRRYLADPDWYTPWRNRIMGLIYRLSSCVVVNSWAVRALLIARHRLSAKRIRVIHNGVDVDRFAAADGDRGELLPGSTALSRVIAVVANMYGAVKGHGNLIEAAALVCAAEPEALFVMIGDGPERPKLEQKVSVLSLKKNFVFLGQRSDVPQLLSCCDAFVLPSEAEACPNAVLEAMSAGLPVVATNAGGAREIIEDEISGLLVPPSNPQALAAAILNVLQDPAFAHCLGRAARKRARDRFSFEQLMSEIKLLYDLPRGKHSAGRSPLPV